MITDVDVYFSQGCGRCNRFGTPDCSTRLWAAGLAKLREICCSMDLKETVKWGHPCYMHADRNVAIIGAFRADFRLTFFQAGLMQDPDKLLETQGPNSKTPSMIRFAANEQVVEKEAQLRSYLAEAIDFAAKGLKAPKDTSEPDMPEELMDALDADPVLSEAFYALTPGRRKSYVINLNGAKQPETRIRRIAGFRDKIFAGKGALER